MNEFEFEPSKITLENLASLSLSQSVGAERRICEISEIAYSAADFFVKMTNDGYGVYEVLSVISEASLFIPDVPHGSSLDENKTALCSFLTALSAYDKAAFSRILTEHLTSLGISLCEADFFEEYHPNESIAFVKTPLASEAFDVFSQQMSEPRLKYVKDMKEAASQLLRGDVGYIILPFEERGGVRLRSVVELLFREDLKINSLTPVFGAYGAADMKYALISKHISLPSIDEGDDRYLEIRLDTERATELSELLAVAETFDIIPYRINTQNIDGEGKTQTHYSVVLKREGGDFSEYLAYLTIFAENYIAVGIYKNLE